MPIADASQYSPEEMFKKMHPEMESKMNDEDINPTFPELEGSWIRKENYDALQAKLDECELALDDMRLGKAIAESKLDDAREGLMDINAEFVGTPAGIIARETLEKIKEA